MELKNRVITLLTDFGTQDGYVGAMKGILIKHAPAATIVDISHDIQPYNIRQAAFAILNYANHFPEGTVHVVVVDPGVGTERRGIVLQCNNRFFIGPDNGVFSYILFEEDLQVLQILESRLGHSVSSSFHGRDVFAPVAAMLANGEDINPITTPVKDPVSFFEPCELINDHEMELTVVHIDHFGNVIFNFSRADWKKLNWSNNLRLKLERGFIQGLHNTFGEVPEGGVLLMWDSSDFLQLAQNKGNAAKLLNIQVGQKFRLIHKR
ncbi:MAG: hypothetical protein Kow0037_14250 [Calditrichia bacterium]